MAKKNKGAKSGDSSGKSTNATKDEYYKSVIKELEMEKEFTALKMDEMDRQIGRLRSHATELETSYDDAIANFKKLDEDRSDIIAYLKRTVQQKVDEIVELTERNVALRKSSEATTIKLQEEIEAMRVENKQTLDRMVAEIKLLTGKLASLEEFRAAREELYNKFTLQEQTMLEQDEKYHQLVYALQKEHMLSKNKLRKEMEDKLIKLSTDFHKTTQSQIASTTQNLIRENIAINNELFLLIGSWQMIHTENEDLKAKLKEVTLDGDLTKDQLDKTLHTNVTLNQIINKLANENFKITSYAEQFFLDQTKIKVLEQKNEELELEKRNLSFDADKLKQEKHALLVNIDELAVKFNKVQCHNSKLERIIHKSTLVVKEGIGLENICVSELDVAELHARKQTLLASLLEILNEDFLLISIPADGDASVPTITAEQWQDNFDYFKKEDA